MWQQIPLARPCVSRGIPGDPASGCCILLVPTHCHRDAHETQQPVCHSGRQSRFLFASCEWGCEKYYDQGGEGLRRILNIPHPTQTKSPPLQQTLSRRRRGTKKQFSVCYTRGPLYNKYSAMRKGCRLCGQTWKPNFCFSNKSFELIRKLMLKPNRWRWPLPLFVWFQGFDPDESLSGGRMPLQIGDTPSDIG